MSRFVVLALLLLTLCVQTITIETSSSEQSAGQQRGHSCPRRRRVRRPVLTAAQRRAITRRHRPAGRAETTRWLAQTPPPLVLRPLAAQDPFVLIPASDSGGFEADDLLLAERAMTGANGAHHEIHPRLMELVYQAVRHFRAPYVFVISGVRDDRATSRHAQGRAIDLVLPGVSDRRLAAYLRPMGYVGVGIYPTSGFVHVDVRARSYFWSDSSGPGQPNRERQILRNLTFRYDRAARQRGVEPTADLHIDDRPEGSVEVNDDDAEVSLDAGADAQ